jgi:hypothetical protein
MIGGQFKLKYLPSGSCAKSEEALPKEGEKHLFFCLQMRGIDCLLAFALRTFSPMNPDLHREILFSGRFAGSDFHRHRLVSGKVEPSIETLLLPPHFTGLSRKGDFR